MATTPSPSPPSPSPAELEYRRQVSGALEKLKSEAEKQEAQHHQHFLENQQKAAQLNKMMIVSTVLSLTGLSGNLPVVAQLSHRFPRAVPGAVIGGVFCGSLALVTKCLVHLDDGVVSLRDYHRRAADDFASVSSRVEHLLMLSPLLTREDFSTRYENLQAVSQKHRRLSD